MANTPITFNNNVPVFTPPLTANYAGQTLPPHKNPLNTAPQQVRKEA